MAAPQKISPTPEKMWLQATESSALFPDAGEQLSVVDKKLVRGVRLIQNRVSEFSKSSQLSKKNVTKITEI